MRKLFWFITYISTSLAEYRQLTLQHVADDMKVSHSGVFSTTQTNRLTGCFWDCINTLRCACTHIYHHGNNDTFSCTLIPAEWCNTKLEYALGYTFYTSSHRIFKLQLTHGPQFCISYEESTLKLDFCSSKYTYFQIDRYGKLMAGNLCVYAVNDEFRLTEDCASSWKFEFVGTEEKSYIKVKTENMLCVHVYQAHYDTQYATLTPFSHCGYFSQTEFRRLMLEK